MAEIYSLERSFIGFPNPINCLRFASGPLSYALILLQRIALSPTGRIRFFSRHPAMFGIAVLTIKYLVELRGWNGIALTAVRSSDTRISIDDPGPWIMSLAIKATYFVCVPPEVCLVDWDIDYLNSAAPPSGSVSMKSQRDKYRQRILVDFELHYHPGRCVPSELKEALPAGRFRPVCKIRQAKRGACIDSDCQHDQAARAMVFDEDHSASNSLRNKHSIRKRAMEYVDDREIKIGRFFPRLNFLMNGPDLWTRGDKFVTFEQYVEKLSVEANDLRGKINREQKESKILSSMITMTTVAKAKHQNRLVETKSVHKDALLELEKMKDTMKRMEPERAEMLAEAPITLRRSGPRVRPLRLFGTESTLTDLYAAGVNRDEGNTKTHSTAMVEEVEGRPRMLTQEADGMNAVDEDISQKSDAIDQKVPYYQRKLESLAASYTVRRSVESLSGSDNEFSDASRRSNPASSL
ncbi:hypothetical protein BC629DRAFT_1442960 [Irpex lacteus]|nr:hypothetical protein BC629DRAFT_1442960 [Irpex lacteus]